MPQSFTADTINTTMDIRKKLRKKVKNKKNTTTSTTILSLDLSIKPTKLFSVNAPSALLLLNEFLHCIILKDYLKVNLILF